MNRTPLEDHVHDALHRRVDPIQHAPLSVTDVRRRAGRIQRRRTAVAGVAVAAVLAIAIPVGLSVNGPSQRSDVPPATQSPSPTPQLASGTVRVDPRTAEVITESPVPLMDVDGPSLITSDGTIDLPRVFDTLTPYLDGWAGIAVQDEPDVPWSTIEFLDADLDVQDGGGAASGGLVVSPDGQRIAWSEYTGSQWQVVVADPSGGAEPVYTTFPPAPESHRVEPVGFISADEVAVRAFDDTTTTRTYAAGGGEPVEIPGLLEVDAASPATGAVAGLTDLSLKKKCSAVVDGLARTGARTWETCDHRLGPFSDNGTYVVGTDPEADGYGPSAITVLDGATGEEIVTFEAVLPRRTVGGFWTQMAWVGDEALVVRMYAGDDTYVMRLGLDGSVQRIDIPSSGLSGLSVAVPS
ncbi:MAG TPA: hypothetical protein VGV65_09090 [Nocardioides sp.]|nr:hypothetical protein [Nocardioides sp.]